eukprot:SAG22_NODE_504_length_9692_cov_366.074325_5_plen_102_part_00
MVEIEANEAPDVVQTDANDAPDADNVRSDATSEDNDEEGPSTQDATRTGVKSSITPATVSLHAEATPESNRGWIDVVVAPGAFCPIPGFAQFTRRKSEATF